MMQFDVPYIREDKYIESSLDWLDKKGDCYVRVILEERKSLYRKLYSEDSEKDFQNICDDYKWRYPSIRFFGGNRKFDWKQLYDFGNDVQLDDKYSSTTSLFHSKKRWLAKLDDLWPWLYARIHNKKNFAKGTDKQCLFMDFVDIK